MKNIINYLSLAEILKERSSSNQGITFITGDQDKFLSYAELYNNALIVLAKLHHIGIKESDELLFQIDDNKTFVEFFWACILGKIIPVPVNLASNEEGINKVNNVYKILTCPTLITSHAHYEKIKEKLDKNIKPHFVEDFVHDNNYLPVTELPAITAEDIAFIQFSSGSTGVPKGVVLTHKNLLANIDGINKCANHLPSDIFLGWMPLTHDMGLIGFHILPLALNLNQNNIPTDFFIRKPMVWIKKASQYKATTLSSPNFGYHYLIKFFKTEEAEGIDLSNVRHIYNGAEPISPLLCNEFLDFMANFGLKRSVMFTVYGLAEASVAVAFPEPQKEFETIYANRNNLNIDKDIILAHKNEKDAIPFVVEGKAIDHCQLKIADNKGHKVGEDHIGLIFIKGDNVTNRYYNNEQATKELITPDGWVNTGDLGFIHDGKLVVTGREKEIIFVGGQNYYPSDIERVIELVDGVDLGKVVAIGSWSEKKAKEELIVFYLYRKNKFDDFLKIAEQIRDVVYKNMGLIVDLVLPIKQVPKTTSGKVRRGHLKKAYKDGEFAEIIDTIYNKAQIEFRERNESHISLLKEKFSNSLILIASKAFIINASEIDIHSNLSGQNLSSMGIVQFTSELNQKFNFTYSPQIIFEHTSLNSLIEQIISEQTEKLSSFYSLSLKPLKILQTKINVNENIPNNSFETEELIDKVAIVGISGIFPNAENIEKFWSLLNNAACSITEIPPNRWEWKKYNSVDDQSGKWGGFIADYDMFEPSFFNISPREATIMDPQHRLFLESAWCALEDAGITPSSLSDTETGVFVGVSTHDYESFVDEDKLEIDENYGIGLAQTMLSNRLSYFLNIHGPSMSIDTACSSSLVALHEAVKSIHAGECTQAIVGGVNLLLSPVQYSTLQKAGFLSNEGKCKTFCNTADGYVRGEGVCSIIIKPLKQALKDKNQIYAVIRGSAINHGGLANSLTAPNPNAQANLLIKAYKNANVDVNHISYIEAHGTGTKLGDPIEISGLKKAFNELNGGDSKEFNYCGIGSVKSNIGHMEAAAGMAGLIKVLLAIKHKTIPSTVNFKELNSYIELDNSPFYIVDKPTEWKRFKDASNNEIPRIAGISSFGFGGTNAHVVVQESIEKSYTTIDGIERLFCISAKDKDTLKEYLKKFLEYLKRSNAEVDQNIQLAQIAYTLHVGREDMAERIAFTAKSVSELTDKIDDFISNNNTSSPAFYNSRNSDISRLFKNDIVKEMINKALAEHNILSLAEIWSCGATIDWKILYANESLSICSLPTYAFQKKRYHISSLIKDVAPGRTQNISHTGSSISSIYNNKDVKSGIYQIVQNSLGTEIKETDNFYSLGGSSINAARIINQINEKYSTNILVSKLLSLSNMGEFANYILSQVEEVKHVCNDKTDLQLINNNTQPNENNIDQLWDLSSDQERLWMLCKVMPRNPAFNIPVAFSISQALQMDKLYRSFHVALNKHNILKGKIEEINYAPKLNVPADVDYKIMIDEIKNEDINSKLKTESEKPFDINKDALVRLKVFRIKNERFIIFINLHHLISDALSAVVFANDLLKGYFNLINDKEIGLELSNLSFNDFVKNQKGLVARNEKEQLTFWKSTLSDFSPNLNLPYDFERPEVQQYKAGQITFSLNSEKHESLRQLAINNKITLFAILLASFNSTLAKICNQEDIIVGCPLANRENSGTETMVGFFAKTIALRNQISPEDSFIEIINKVKNNFLLALDNSDVPYFKIVEAVAPKRTGTYNPLFKVMFSMVSFPDFSANIAPSVERLSIFSGYNDYDIFLRVEQEGGRLKGSFDYALSMFSKETVQRILDSYLSFIDQVLANPQIKLSEISLAEIFEKVNAQGAKQNIIVSSTFSDQPIKKTLEFWSNQLKINSKVHLAEYNQTFNELLGNFSMSVNNTGVNVVLIRIDDWVRFLPDTDDLQLHAEKTTDEFIASVLSATNRFQSPIFLGILPSDPENSKLPQEIVSRLEAKIATTVSAGIHVFDHQKILNNYHVARIFDKITDKQGHLPFTEDYYAAVATTVIRMLYALKRMPFKVIVLDCDNTLWKGVAAEDGAENLVIDQAHKEFQKCIVKQHENGVLICLCSKNEEHDVLNVFNVLEDIMPLKREHVVAMKINWNTKSQNIRELSEELNLGLDSFIFIDDNPVECAEVSSSLPEVLTIQFPNDDDDNKIKNLVNHGWFFDHLKVTSEDKNRSGLYKVELKRIQESQKFISYTDFLKSLELKIDICELNEDNVERISQLSQRTNQLNNTTIRRTEPEIHALIDNNFPVCYSVSVSDKFGSYGLVGAFILKFDQASTVYIDSFILSCRVIGKGVEHAMFNKIGEIAQSQNLEKIIFPYVPTNRNTPIFDFINALNNGNAKISDTRQEFSFDAGFAASVAFVPKSNVVQKKENSDIKFSERLELPILLKIIDQYTTIENIRNVSLVNRSDQKTSINESKKQIVENESIELIIRKIKELIDINTIDINDNFFDMGLNSIQIVQLVSMLQENITVNLESVDLFKYTTVKALSEFISQNNNNNNNNKSTNQFEKIKQRAKRYKENLEIMSR
jgi:FkbH-like protein